MKSSIVFAPFAFLIASAAVVAGSTANDSTIGTLPEGSVPAEVVVRPPKDYEIKVREYYPIEIELKYGELNFGKDEKYSYYDWDYKKLPPKAIFKKICKTFIHFSPFKFTYEDSKKYCKVYGSELLEFDSYFQLKCFAFFLKENKINEVFWFKVREEVKKYDDKKEEKWEDKKAFFLFFDFKKNKLVIDHTKDRKVKYNPLCEIEKKEKKEYGKYY